MSWREKLVVRILLLIARMVAEDVVIAEEIKHLSNHVSATAPEDERLQLIEAK